MADLMHSFMAIKRTVRASEESRELGDLVGADVAMITGSMQTIDGGFAA
jgi:cyclic-di-GMP-binding biofilm dispersal mediator protein